MPTAVFHYVDISRLTNAGRTVNLLSGHQVAVVDSFLRPRNPIEDLRKEGIGVHEANWCLECGSNYSKRSVIYIIVIVVATD